MKKTSEYCKTWREKNREKWNTYMREYNARRRDEYNAYQREWRAKHPDSAKASSTAWRKANPDKVYELGRRWRASPGYKLWYASTVEQRKTHIRRVRLKRLSAAGSHTQQEWLAAIKASGYRCTYCDAPVTRITASPDHKTPLTRGGTDNIDNIAVSCFTCNRHKGRRTEEEFRKLLALITRRDS